MRLMDQLKSNVNHIGKYRPELDGLRAFAVIAVIINHFNKSLLESGYLGVDIFFVISGYVITSSLLSRRINGFRPFISSFYKRRIKNLFGIKKVYRKYKTIFLKNLIKIKWKNLMITK